MKCSKTVPAVKAWFLIVCSINTLNICKWKQYSWLKLPVINKTICNWGWSVYHHTNLNESFDISLQGTTWVIYVHCSMALMTPCTKIEPNSKQTSYMILCTIWQMKKTSQVSAYNPYHQFCVVDFSYCPFKSVPQIVYVKHILLVQKSSISTKILCQSSINIDLCITTIFPKKITGVFFFICLLRSL